MAAQATGSDIMDGRTGVAVSSAAVSQRRSASSEAEGCMADANEGAANAMASATRLNPNQHVRLVAIDDSLAVAKLALAEVEKCGLECAQRHLSLTVVILGGGGAHLAQLLLKSCTILEEVVICGGQGGGEVDAGIVPESIGTEPGSQLRKPKICHWQSSCRSAAQLSKLRAALVRAGRQAVAVVATSELGAVPALRLLQTWLHMRICCLLVAPLELPESRDRSSRKLLYRIGRCQLSGAQLPRRTQGLSRAWSAFVTTAFADALAPSVSGRLQGGSDSIGLQNDASERFRISAVRVQSRTDPFECEPLEAASARATDAVLRATACASASARACGETDACVVATRKPFQDDAPQSAVCDGAARRSDAAGEEASQPRGMTPLPPIPASVLTSVDQLAEVRQRIDAAVKEMPFVVLRDGNRARLVVSSAARYKSGGYASEHYLQDLPLVHAAAYELVLDSNEAEDGSCSAAPCGAAVGFISVLAYGSEDPSNRLQAAVPWRTLCAAQVERLVVRSGHRGSGAKEALLRVCAAFHALGYATRIKTASNAVHESFLRCPLLAYEGHRKAGTISCGVRRPGKLYVRAQHGAQPPSTRLDARADNSAAYGLAGSARQISMERATGSRSVDVDARLNDGFDQLGRLRAQSTRQLGERFVERERHGPVRELKSNLDARMTESQATSSDLSQWPGSSATHCDGAAQETAATRRRMRVLLNKLTPDSFATLLPQIAALIDGESLLRVCLGLALTRAASEAVYCALYADCCLRICAILSPAQHTRLANGPVTSDDATDASTGIDATTATDAASAHAADATTHDSPPHPACSVAASFDAACAEPAASAMPLTANVKVERIGSAAHPAHAPNGPHARSWTVARNEFVRVVGSVARDHFSRSGEATQEVHVQPERVGEAHARRQDQRRHAQKPQPQHDREAGCEQVQKAAAHSVQTHHDKSSSAADANTNNDADATNARAAANAANANANAAQMNVGAAAAAAAAEAIEHVLGPRSARNEAGVGRVVGQLLRRRLLPANACADLLESHSLARVCAALQQAGPEIEHADASLLCRLLERLRAALVDQQEPERPAAEAEPTARARMSGALRHAIEEVLALNRRHWQRKRGVVSATAQDAPPPTRGQVHQEAARELGLTLVAVETPREKLRGLREGWVYWYVGAPVIHPGTGENYVYNQLSQRFEPKTADDVTCRSSFACARG